MSAVPPTVPTEIPLRHASFRQGAVVGTWTEACIVDGALVVEAETPLSPSAGVLVRMTGTTGRALAVTTEPPLRIEEPGHPTLWVLPLAAESEALDVLQEPMEPEHRPTPAAAEARPGLGRTASFSLFLSLIALAGAGALTIALTLG